LVLRVFTIFDLEHELLGVRSDLGGTTRLHILLNLLPVLSKLEKRLNKSLLLLISPMPRGLFIFAFLFRLFLLLGAFKQIAED